MQENELFWKEIHAPAIVGIPPIYAIRELCFCSNGNIRHYGRERINGEVFKVYLESEDMGLTWKKHLQAPEDPGAMVKCPWADYYLRLDPNPVLTAFRSSRGPGFPAEKTVVIGLRAKQPRPLLPLRSRKRWIAGISNVECLNGTCYHAGVCYSDDDGETWTYTDVPEVPDVERQFACDKRPHWFNNGCEPTIAELPDGTLLMALRTSGPYVAFSHSFDGGTTWEVPRPVPGFWQANTMPELHMLKDGRLLFIWNNTAMLPTRDPAELPELTPNDLTGEWETAFTNRDALHAAISEDNGKTWHGFREIILTGIRNDTDFRELGNDPAEEQDKSVHQTQMLELPNGKILLALGQNPAARRLVLFDPSWLYETGRKEDFRHGLGAVSHHLYVKSPSGGRAGWAGHCAWNRIPGAVMAREPAENGKVSRYRESLWLCRLDDPRLVSTCSGVVWNFPAARKGTLEIDFRIEGCGFQVALQDHWSNTCDEYLESRSFLVVPISPDEFGCKARWMTLTLHWDLDKGESTLVCGSVTRTLPLKKEGFSPAGPSYLHIQTLAEKEDRAGTFFREFRFNAAEQDFNDNSRNFLIPKKI